MAVDFNGIGANGATGPKGNKVDGVKKTLDATAQSNRNMAPEQSGLSDVKLSQLSVSLQKFEEAVNQAPATDQNKVEHFKSAIASGTYQPNARSIAEKIMRFDE